MSGPGAFESGGSFDKISNLVIGVISIIVAFFLILEYLTSKSDFEQYCTGAVGILVEIFTEGQCSDLELYMYVTGAGSIFCGLCGFIFLILGLISTQKQQPQVILVPQYIQQPQQQQQQLYQDVPQYIQQPQQQQLYQDVPQYIQQPQQQQLDQEQHPPPF